MPGRLVKGIVGGLFNFARKKATGGQGWYEKTIKVRFCPMRNPKAEPFGRNAADSTANKAAKAFANGVTNLATGFDLPSSSRVEGAGEMKCGPEWPDNGSELEDPQGY